VCDAETLGSFKYFLERITGIIFIASHLNFIATGNGQFVLCAPNRSLRLPGGYSMVQRV